MFTQIQETLTLLDTPHVRGSDVAEQFAEGEAAVDVTTIEGDEGSTDFVTIRIPGRDPDAPTLGVVGRLGGIGARPEKAGLVSDADGAIVTIATASYLAEAVDNGERLGGDVILSTHICSDAPTIDHDPVPFMSSPVDIETMNRHEVAAEMDAILSVDATKGNRTHCRRGFAITPPVKQGWILKPSGDLLDIMERVTGEPPSTLTITMQDITPYGNDVHHINSILQPATATDSPVVGVGTTSTVPVAGSATGANYVPDLASAAQFVVETAKDYGHNRAAFVNQEEYEHLLDLYGSMDALQTRGDSR